MQIEFNEVKYQYNKKEYKDIYALNGVSFSIEKGDFIAIVGHTGSGKSTLIQTLNGLILPTSGYSRVDEYLVTNDKKIKKEYLKDKSKEIKKINKKSFLLRRKVGLVFQFAEYQLFESTVLKDVMFGPKNFNMKAEALSLAQNALKDVGLEDFFYEKSPFELSGGEKRRVAIAGVLASNPDILVLDEPTAGLDPSGRKMIMNLIKNLNDKGKTIIIVTHDMEIVKDYSKKVAIMNDGNLIKLTTPHELFNDENILKYSLEIPSFYKFKNLLKIKGYPYDLSNFSNIEELIEFIGEKHE